MVWLYYVYHNLVLEILAIGSTPLLEQCFLLYLQVLSNQDSDITLGSCYISNVRIYSTMTFP
jgi:hypothetical protein